jgi:hypothetical protein
MSTEQRPHTSTPPERQGSAVPLPRNASSWASKVERLTVPAGMEGVGFTVDGKRVTGPQQGFGRLWQRDYWTDLGAAVTVHELIADWRAHFPDFWPRGSVFHAGLTGIQPGDVAPLEAGVAHGPKIVTGILVLYADDESFTFITPEGHMFAGMITFSGEEVDGRTLARIRILIRPSDPMVEAAWAVAKREEDRFWLTTLRNVAARHGVTDPELHSETVCVDRARLWRNWRNIRHNAALRTAWHAVSSPFRRASAG